MGKVRFGLKNFTYFPITFDENGVPTYGAASKVLGAVSATFDAQGDNSKFFADDGEYASLDSNNGYEGTFECAGLSEQNQIDLLGFVRATDGSLLETNKIVDKWFGFKFERQNNNGTAEGFAFYKAKLSRPSISANTKAESVSVDTETLTITIVPCPMNSTSNEGAVKSIKEINDSTRTAFYASMAIAAVNPMSVAPVSVTAVKGGSAVTATVSGATGTITTNSATVISDSGVTVTVNGSTISVTASSSAQVTSTPYVLTISDTASHSCTLNVSVSASA